MMNKNITDHLTISKMTNWIVGKKLNDCELGKKLRGYYWDVRDDMRDNK